MKAWNLENIGVLKYSEDFARPLIREHEVLISVKAAGICGSDIQRVYENGAYRMPMIIGHEFAGQVVETGAQVSNEWMNKRVGIYPLIPCTECSSCLEKKYEMCSHYSYLGSRENGGFGEYVAVPEWNLIQLPESVNYEQAAMLEPMGVAVHAIRRLNMDESTTIVVYGLGTIGQLLIMFLLEKGMKNIYAIGSKASQKEAVTALGISKQNYCDSREHDVTNFVQHMTNKKGADVIFECVGKNETVTQAIELAAAGGQICLVGNPYTDIKLNKTTYWKILRHQLTLIGTWNSSFWGEQDYEAAQDDWHYVLRCLEDNRIAPEKLITHRLSIVDLYRGFEIMKDKSEEYIKIMMVNI